MSHSSQVWLCFAQRALFAPMPCTDAVLCVSTRGCRAASPRPEIGFVLPAWPGACRFPTVWWVVGIHAPPGWRSCVSWLLKALYSVVQVLYRSVYCLSSKIRTPRGNGVRLAFGGGSSFCQGGSRATQEPPPRAGVPRAQSGPCGQERTCSSAAPGWVFLKCRARQRTIVDPLANGRPSGGQRMVATVFRPHPGSVCDSVLRGSRLLLSSRAQPRDLAAIDGCVVCEAGCLDCATLRST